LKNVFRVPSAELFKIPTVANIPKKPLVKQQAVTVNQLQNNMKVTSLNEKSNTDQENNKNMGLSNNKDE